MIFERERETKYEWGKGRERETEGDTVSKAGSSLQAVSTEPDTGHEFMSCEIMAWTKVGRLTDWATQAPRSKFLLLNCFAYFQELMHIIRDNAEFISLSPSSMHGPNFKQFPFTLITFYFILYYFHIYKENAIVWGASRYLSLRFTNSHTLKH